MLRSPAPLKTNPATRLPIVASGWIARQCATNSRARLTRPSFAQHPAIMADLWGLWCTPVKVCQGLRVAAHHELGDPERPPVPGRSEIRVYAPCIAQLLEPLFRAADSGKEYTESGLGRRFGRINLDGALQMGQRQIEASSFQVEQTQRRVARVSPSESSTPRFASANARSRISGDRPSPRCQSNVRRIASRL